MRTGQTMRHIINASDFDVSRCPRPGQGTFVFFGKTPFGINHSMMDKPFLPDAAGLYQCFFREIESDAPSN